MNAIGWRRVGIALAMVALAAFASYFVNHLNVNPTDYTWQQEYLFPAVNPVGSEFRSTLYRPAEALLHGASPYAGSRTPYPPLAVLVGVPFQTLDENHAYLVQVWLLIGMNVVTLWMALKVSGKAFAGAAGHEAAVDQGLVFPLFCGLCLWLVTSYGFLFSIERGSFDIFAGLSAMIGLWLTVTRPDRVWLQVLCFSIAAHLNVDLAILLVLPVWKHGWRSLLPLAVVNLVLLLCLGPANVMHFLNSVTGAFQAPDLWQGNHSAASIAHVINDYLDERGLGLIPVWVFCALPVGLWVAGGIVLLRRGYDHAGAVWLYCLSVPLMNLIPATSPDTKLVLLVAPLAMAWFHTVWEYANSGQRVRLLQMAAVGGLAAILGLSYTRLPAVVGNKYPFVLAFQAAVLWMLVTPLAGKRPGVRGVGAPAEGTPWSSGRPRSGHTSFRGSDHVASKSRRAGVLRPRVLHPRRYRT